MIKRIGMWGLIGGAIACAWALYVMLMQPGSLSTGPAVIWWIAQWSCPIVLLGQWLHFGVKLYWVVLTNVATYAAAGFLFAALRHPTRVLGKA